MLGVRRLPSFFGIAQNPHHLIFGHLEFDGVRSDLEFRILNGFIDDCPGTLVLEVGHVVHEKHREDDQKDHDGCTDFD